MLTQKSALIHVDGNLNYRWYIDEILEPVAMSFGHQEIRPGFIFQDDNTHPNAAHIVQEYHETHLDYTHMEWPALSSNLNLEYQNI